MSAQPPNQKININLVMIIIIIILIFAVIWFYRSSEQKVSNNSVSNERNVAESNPPTNINYEISEADHVLGPDDAPITVVEFSDFQCPYCSTFQKTMDTIIKKYPDKIKWVYKHFPLSTIHPNAQPAAEAAECAGEQNKFWEFGDLLFANQANLSRDTYVNLAQQADLNIDSFTQCLDEEKYKQKISQDYSQGLSLGVQGTPGNIINGTLYPGALTVEQMEQIINSY